MRITSHLCHSPVNCRPKWHKWEIMRFSNGSSAEIRQAFRISSQMTGVGNNSDLSYRLKVRFPGVAEQERLQLRK